MSQTALTGQDAVGCVGAPRCLASPAASKVSGQILAVDGHMESMVS